LASVISCKSSPDKQETVRDTGLENAHPVDQAHIQAPDPETIVFQAGDKEILEQVLEHHSGDTELPVSALMVKVGSFFLETPYVAFTLETTENEQLIINLRELDCTTFAENCLALSRTIKSRKHSFEQFASELQAIRYREGKIDGYPSRLHYFCDWILANEQKMLVLNLPEGLQQTSFRKEINFMSTHPGSYRQLKEDSVLIQAIASQEKLLSSREMYYIPEGEVARVESQLMDGDIVGITTNMEGIAIQHVGILVRVEGRIHLLHASSSAEKVVLSDMTLEEYLQNSKSASGIMLARPI
jgi:hypothetical protein